MTRRRPRTAIPAFLAIAATLAVASASLAATIVTVSQVGRAFTARQVALRPGDVVRFLNADSFIHHVQVRSDTMNFDSPEQEPGQSIDLAFPTAGSFAVRCAIHPKMLLQVDVR